jgi:hypothetical protein
MKFKRKEMAQMVRNRIEAETYPNSQISQEGIKMTNRRFSRMRSVAFKALVIGLASLVLVFAGPVSTMLAGPSKPPPGFTIVLVTGQVTFCENEELVQGAKVIVYSKKKPDLKVETTTNSEGKFSASAILFGAHVQKALSDLGVEFPGFMIGKIASFVISLPFVGTFISITACLLNPCNNPDIQIRIGPEFGGAFAGGGIVNMEAFVGELRGFEVIANDGDPDKPAPMDYLSLFARDVATPLPLGAEWIPTIAAPFAKSASGTFRWTPLPTQARPEPYILQFKTRDVCPGSEATVEARITVKTQLPNLVPVEVQPMKLGGPQWRVKFRVHNQGSVGAGATQVRIRGVRVGDGRVVEYSFGTGALDPFATTGEIFADFAGGDYDVEIFVDPENKVQEVDESDNIVRLQLRS